MASILSMLLACGAEAPIEPAVELDTAPVELAVDYVSPAMAFGLLDELLDEVGSPDCEASLYEDGLYADGAGFREFWGACPGFADLGTVERYEDPSLTWMEVQGLSLHDAFGDETLRLDGAVVLTQDDGLASLDMAVSGCGTDLGVDCTDAVQLDLSWTIIGSADGRQDVVVSGTFVTPEHGPVAVDGSFVLDAELCDGPMDGLIRLEGAQSHVLRFAPDCDSCAGIAVDGREAGSFCK